MVNDILERAGIPGRRSRFPKPPAGTYAVWLDDITTDGPDGIPAILTHDVTVELYELAPDDEKEAALEAELTAAGLQWTKQDRYWLQTEQRYQVLFEFSYIEKRRF